MPPLTGYVLRVDRPTHAVIRWPPGAIGPFDIQIESHSIIYNKSFHFEKHFEIYTIVSGLSGEVKICLRLVNFTCCTGNKIESVTTALIEL
jgi:hypothetical protein